MIYDSLGDRMKAYEDVSRAYLIRRIPVIIRIDGKAFHTLTKQFKGKWNYDFVKIMQEVTKECMDHMQGCNFAYCQSDEISFLLTDYRTITTDAWFAYNINKMNSISASLASTTFTLNYGSVGLFDSRAFSVPIDEVCNYFIWRQKDATRNAILSAGYEHFSHKALHNLSCNEVQEKLWQEKNINFNDYPIIRKRGFCIVNDIIDEEITIFTQDRNYVEKFVNIRED